MSWRGTRWLLVVMIAAGCAVGTTGIRRDANYDPRYAYVYGRFFMKTEPRPGATAGGQSMGLLIRCQNGSEYTLGAIDKRDVQVLEVRPSRCWFIEVILDDQDRMIHKHVPVPPEVQRPLDLSPGGAYYLGDFFAKGELWSNRELLAEGLHVLEWAMDPADDQFEPTTAEMKQTFPKLASLPAVDMRLFSAPKRKRDNGIAAAPGEPPMSPERVARLAPLIKRNYGSPAECEAACAAGQCLPYRSDAGPAMACVIRCDKNGDCPDGLACNCPNSEKIAGPSCHPIATTPQDPMARICLSVEKAGQRR